MRLTFEETAALVDDNAKASGPWCNDVNFTSKPGRWEEVELQDDSDWEGVTGTSDVQSFTSDDDLSADETPVTRFLDEAMALRSTQRCGISHHCCSELQRLFSLSITA